ncbi:uncharacterized protein LOC112681298 [Sipha flava]|uniref:Uncharacterized protein LOC112681298 n=2 Tax=Sipha flava TaxID=143950 RepID=A0A2S2QBX0_9HEMI|nr:uncharacterized protein LOC112681298 [Sipha flava]
MLTETIKYDVYFMNNAPDKQFLESIILNIYTELYKFYESKNIYIWQSFEWLSGTYIINLTHSSNSLNEVKEKIGKYNEENVPYLVFYDLLLPWNLNIESLIDFKILTDNYILDNLFQFVWCQARIIYLFFKHNSIENIGPEVFQRLKKSIKWYKSGTPELYKLMSLTDDHFTVPENIESIITAIENNSIELFYLMNTEILNKNKSKTEYCSLNSESVDFTINLNQKFLENCYNAISLINAYYSIAINSNVTIINKTYNFFLGHEFCTKNNELFIPGVIFITPEAHNSNLSKL